jgi:hypothetical protein
MKNIVLFLLLSIPALGGDQVIPVMPTPTPRPTLTPAGGEDEKPEDNISNTNSIPWFDFLNWGGCGGAYFVNPAPKPFPMLLPIPTPPPIIGTPYSTI